MCVSDHDMSDMTGGGQSPDAGFTSPVTDGDLPTAISPRPGNLASTPAATGSSVVILVGYLNGEIKIVTKTERSELSWIGAGMIGP